MQPFEIVKANKLRTAAFGVALLLVLVVTLAATQHISPLSWGWYQPFNTSSGVALDGYDPVAYHVAQRAQRGDASITSTWSDTEWHFASAENKALFMADPERYAPQFGGNCAKAIATGLTARSNPEFWHIEDGALYVFASESVRDDWVEGIPGGTLAEARVAWGLR